VTCAKYAKENGLLDKPGWKTLKRIATRAIVFDRMLKQARMSSERNGPIYKFGVRVPRHKGEATKLDAENGDTKWHDAEQAEMSQIFEYKVFEDFSDGFSDQRRKKVIARMQADGYTHIRVHFVYDCKHDLRRKARMVADGHLTDPRSDTYSGVVSLGKVY